MLMELKDGKMEYKLPNDWNKILAIIDCNHPIKCIL